MRFFAGGSTATLVSSSTVEEFANAANSFCVAISAKDALFLALEDFPFFAEIAVLGVAAADFFNEDFILELEVGGGGGGDTIGSGANATSLLRFLELLGVAFLTDCTSGADDNKPRSDKAGGDRTAATAAATPALEALLAFVTLAGAVADTVEYRLAFFDDDDEEEVCSSSAGGATTANEALFLADETRVGGGGGTGKSSSCCSATAVLAFLPFLPRPDAFFAGFETSSTTATEITSTPVVDFLPFFEDTGAGAGA